MRTIITRSVLVAVVISLGLGAALGQGTREGGRRDRRRNRSEDRSTSADDSAQRNARTESFLRMLDANHNGMIEAEEVPATQKSMVEGIFRRVGIEPKYPVSVSRVLEAMTESGRRGRSETADGASERKPGPDNPKTQQPAVRGFGPPGGDAPQSPGTGDFSRPAASPPSSSEHKSKSGETATSSESKTADSVTPPPRGSGRFRTPKERLPAGLPEWFRRLDMDGDGQVTMAEFAREWNPEKMAEFDRLDLNHDGIITAAECLKAEKRSSRP
jgi:Ca2+-binding EF-hand superfamily protein